MIIVDGKSAGGKSRDSSGLIPENLTELLGEHLNSILGEKMGLLIDEIRKVKGTVVHRVDGEVSDISDAESLKNIAAIMASKSSVEETNIQSLGNKQELKQDSEKSRTIDLLGEILD